MRRFYLIFAIVFCIIFLPIACAQISTQDFRVMFYNVENLFDTEDDPETNDEEFTDRKSVV